MAETESFESQKIVTEEPIKQVHDGEQDNISPVEEASESTEAPSEASTKAEDEILLEDSTVDDSADTPTLAKNTKDETNDKVEINDQEIREDNKDASHDDINTIDDTKDNSYDDEYYYDDDYYYDDEEENFIDVPVTDVLQPNDKISLEQVVNIEPQDFDLTSPEVDDRVVRQTDITQLRQRSRSRGKQRRTRQFNNQQQFQQQQTAGATQQLSPERQQFAQQQQAFIQRQQQLVQQQQQAFLAQQQPQQQFTQQQQQFFPQQQQVQPSTQLNQFAQVGPQAARPVSDRFQSPGFLNRVQQQNTFAPAPQFNSQPQQQLTQEQLTQLALQQQFIQQQQQQQQTLQQQQQAPQQQFVSPNQTPALSQQSRFVSFGQNGQNSVPLTTPRSAFQTQFQATAQPRFPTTSKPQFQGTAQPQFRGTPQPQFQTFQATPNSFSQTNVVGGTPQPNFQSFQNNQNENIQVRPVGQPGSQSFNIQELGFQGFDFDGSNSIGEQNQSFFPQEPSIPRRPSNARPPPNADPRQKDQVVNQFPTLTLNAPSSSDPITNFAPQVESESTSGPIHQLWNQLFQGQAQKQTLKQETPAAVTTPRAPTITTLRSAVPRITPTPVPRAPGTKPNSPNFAHFQAQGGVAGGNTGGVAIAPTRRPRIRGSKKRLRLRNRPQNAVAVDSSNGFVPTPPPSSSSSRERQRTRTRLQTINKNLSPTPPTNTQSRLPSFNNLQESTRSNAGAQTAAAGNNFINLSELAGVKELETALKQRDDEIRKLRNQELKNRDKEIRNLKGQLREAEKSFESQLSQQSRQLTTDASKVQELERSLREKTRLQQQNTARVDELELTLRDQTRRLADSNKKTFELEEALKDLQSDLKQKDRLLRDRDSTVEFQSGQLKEMIKLENRLMDYQKELKLKLNEIENRERKIKELEQLTKKQDQVTLENVQKIQLIESTIDEVEQIVLSKDQIISNLKVNIEEFRSNGQKDEAKIHELEIDLDQRTREVIEKDRKVRELQQTITNYQQALDDKQEDIDELNNRTRLHLEYAAEKKKEIYQLETAVSTLKNTTVSKDEQIVNIGQELKQQISSYNKKLQEIEVFRTNITKSMEIIANREQKVFTLEAAVTSLKDIVQDNNVKIATLNKDIEQRRLEIGEKDKFIQAQREKLTQASQSIKDLQVLLGDAGKTIDKKNNEISDLTETVETFKFDKKNLLGIVQQLATIGNPGINLKNLIANDVNAAASIKKSSKTSRLLAQESQRSLHVHKGKKSKINFNQKPAPSKHQRRSFNTFGSSNSIVNAPIVNDQEASEPITDDDDYATETKVDDKHLPSVVNEKNSQTMDKEVIQASTTVTSFLDDFPSFIDMAQKITTALPTFFTPSTISTTTSKPISSSPSTTATTQGPVTQSTFTLNEAIIPTESSPKQEQFKPSIMVTPSNNQQNIPIFVGSEIDTISAPLDRSDTRKTLRGKLVHNNKNVRKLGHKVLGERRKLFGQRTLYY